MEIINPSCSICDIKMFRKCLICFDYVCINDHHNYVCLECSKSYRVTCDEEFKCPCKENDKE